MMNLKAIGHKICLHEKRYSPNNESQKWKKKK